MIEEDEDVAEAVRRLTPDQQLARKRRQLRAFDISLKKTPLPDHVQAVQDPFEVRVRIVCAPVERLHTSDRSGTDRLGAADPFPIRLGPHTHTPEVAAAIVALLLPRERRVKTTHGTCCGKKCGELTRCPYPIRGRIF